MRLGYVDPANIEEIIADPDNREISLIAICRSNFTVDNALIPKRYSLIRVDERVGIDGRPSQTYGKMMWYPEQNGAFYFAINKPPNVTRGRSDLITVFDWLDFYDSNQISDPDPDSSVV